MESGRGDGSDSTRRSSHSLRSARVSNFQGNRSRRDPRSVGRYRSQRGSSKAVRRWCRCSGGRRNLCYSRHPPNHRGSAYWRLRRGWSRAWSFRPLPTSRNASKRELRVDRSLVFGGMDSDADRTSSVTTPHAWKRHPTNHVFGSRKVGRPQRTDQQATNHRREIPNVRRVTADPQSDWGMPLGTPIRRQHFSVRRFAHALFKRPKALDDVDTSPT